MNGEREPVRAQHRGRCALCDEIVHEGDEIAQYEGEWCHLQCVKDETELEEHYGH
jgi:hypothetical protein